MSYYTYPSLETLILSSNKLVTSARRVWLYRWGLLSVLFAYLTYAESQVRIQEENIKSLVRYGTKNHKKYTDRLHKMLSSTISAHTFIVSCLEISSNLKVLYKYRYWIELVKEKRHRYSAHPSNVDLRKSKFLQTKIKTVKNNHLNIVSYGVSSWSSTGEVIIRLVDLDEKIDTATIYKELTLHPRKDFEFMKKYIEEFSNELKKEWGI